MHKWNRIKAMLAGEQVDRVPWSFWRHFAMQEWSPKRLAELTLQTYKKYDLDLVKLTPTGIYPTQDWGPTIRFSRTDTQHPEWIEAAVPSVDDWPALPRLDITTGAYGRELEAIHRLSKLLDGEAPMVMTIYGPLTIANFLCWDRNGRGRIVEDLRAAPDKVHAGLNVIRDVVRDYATACLEAGASGLFFATNIATHDALTAEEYREFGLPYDMEVLESFVDDSEITILHICRENIMFDLLEDYPVDVINWADRHGPPSLEEARQKTDKALAGGVSTKTLLNGQAEDVLAEARAAIAGAGRTGFMLTPSCTTDGRTPPANLQAMKQAIDETEEV